MTEVKIYIEGGGNSKEERSRCREGFRKLIEKAGFTGRAPRTVACGGRNEAFNDFQTGLKNPNQISLLLVDSEDPVADITDEVDNDFAWRHLRTRDGWVRPDGTQNRQALLMATCMESWISADRAAIFEHCGPTQVQGNALSPLANLETRDRHEIQDALSHATRNSKKSYKKGVRSFDLLAALNPETLDAHLSQFRRFVSVLNEAMPSPSTRRER